MKTAAIYMRVSTVDQHPETQLHDLRAMAQQRGLAELERNLIVERVRAGMRRARLEGRHIGRNPLVLDHQAICRDRHRGQSLRQIAKSHRISTATVQRVLRKHATTSQEQVA